MTRKTTLLMALVLLVISLPAFADQPYKINLNGFVNYEMIYDTRQVVASREGDVLLYPAPKKLDAEGNDLNARPSYNLIALSTRLWVGVQGPEIFGARSSAHVEVDFLGTSNDKFNLLRMRHAYARLQWERTDIIGGQYWHPMFVASSFPGVVAFGGAVPYHVLSRAPQLRLTQQMGKLSLSATLLSQSDFASAGPQGNKADYMRNSGVPELFAQAIYQNDQLMLGTTLGYSQLRPSLETAGGYKNNETFAYMTANAFARITLPGVLIKVQGIYGENLSQFVMLGGYGERELIDPLRGTYSYAGIEAMSVWADMETRGEKVRLGLFGGYSETLGSTAAITGAAWGRSNSISHMYRISPRLIIPRNKATLNFEMIYDVAAYGTPDQNYKFAETTAVGNLRTMVSLRYGF